MTRDEHLEFCRRCQNRQFDPEQGVVCALTAKVADFETECIDFKLDAAVNISVDDREMLTYAELKRMGYRKRRPGI